MSSGLEIALISSVISAATALSVMLATQYIAVRKDEIKFLRERAEHLAAALQTIREAFYEVLDSNFVTTDPKEKNKVLSLTQRLTRSGDPAEILVNIYFPDLCGYWKEHKQNISVFVTTMNNLVISNTNTVFPKKEIDAVFASNDVLIKSITVDFSALTKHWFSSF